MPPSSHDNRRAQLTYAVALTVLSAHLLRIWTRPDYDQQADLKVYVGAIQSHLDGVGLYSFAAANGDPFTYPPVAALILLPLALLPQVIVLAAWPILTVGAVLLLAKVCSDRRPQANYAMGALG